MLFNLYKINEKTNNSDMESLYLTIPLFFIIILLIPIQTQIDIKVDGNNKKISMELCVCKIKIVTIKMLYKNNRILLYINKKQQDINIELSQKQVLFIDQFISNIKDKIQISFFDINAKIGIRYDAYQTAMLCGTLNSLIKMLFAFLKTRKPTSSFCSTVIPIYNKDKFLIKSKICAKISMSELFYSIIVSLLSVRRRMYERNKEQS